MAASRAGPRSTSSSHTQTPIIASETSRWNDTIHGLRSVSTVTPPTTAWAGTPRATTVLRTNGAQSRSPR